MVNDICDSFEVPTHFFFLQLKWHF